MARLKLKPGRDSAEIGQAIVAAWFKVLGSEEVADRQLTDDNNKAELEAVFSEIIDNRVTPFEIVIDPPTPTTANKLKIVVPQPPKKDPDDNDTIDVIDRDMLIKYLKRFHRYSQGRQYHEDLGVAVVFGCGK